MSISDICKRHRISPQFVGCFEQLVDRGVVTSSEFQVRLDTCANYRDCRDEINHVLEGHTSAPQEFLPIDFDQLLSRDHAADNC